MTKLLEPEDVLYDVVVKSCDSDEVERIAAALEPSRPPGANWTIEPRAWTIEPAKAAKAARIARGEIEEENPALDAIIKACAPSHG